MNVAEVVYSLDSEDTFRHVETGDILGEHVVLHEHCHEIASRKELHDQIEVEWILE